MPTIFAGLVESASTRRESVMPSWPTNLQSRPDAVGVEFVAGYGDAPADVPAPIRQAMRLLIGAWYENRESTAIGVSVAELPASVNVGALIAPYVRFRL